ncbi:MetQ/NlpA family ABC transporter substrate-binding protein [Oribacterium asaccharolyticum]|uniref:MetQ/NlpA family ABC transporter substrate-binding protein n=1 Tax=Oribacterium asaccharolyticum TaxID=1501332 RepID=UPI0028E37C05|nr:MetQ/NlpA family ABC transporter substrate-binding protein [Oribacterium asaccharolyticum]
MRKRIAALLLGLAVVSLAACGGQKADTKTETKKETEAGSEKATEKEKAAESEKATEAAAASGETVKIKIGATPSPHAEILEAAKDALKKKGVEIEIVTYNDYVQPNIATDEGQIDANYFQHQPYLDDFNKENNTHVVSVGKIHYEPFGIYAGKSKDLKNIQDGAKIAVPNDTTNEARALLLLEANGIIKLKDGAGLTVTKQDIVENPHNVEIYEVEAAQIPRSLDSVDFACMNGNFAIQANYKPSEALAAEKSDSEAAQTYANIIAVAEKNKDAAWAKTLVEVLTSKEIRDFINKKYEGGVVPLS